MEQENEAVPEQVPAQPSLVQTAAKPNSALPNKVDKPHEERKSAKPARSKQNEPKPEVPKKSITEKMTEGKEKFQKYATFECMWTTSMVF